MSKKKMEQKEEPLKRDELRLEEHMTYYTEVPAHVRDRKPYTPPNEKEVLAQIPGTICEIFVKKGQTVDEGDDLLILEAMKMRNLVVSPISGTIKTIKVKQGEVVRKHSLLIEFE